MARKKKGRSSQESQSGQAAGGFVPVSTHHDPQHSGSVSSNSLELGSTGVPTSDPVSQYSRDSGEYSHRKRNGSRGKVVAIAIVVIALVAAVSGLGFYVYKEVQKNTINQELHNMSQEELKAVDNELTGMTTFDEPFTMLLLGSDARTDDPDMGARTDTIILVRIDPTRNVISMVSIPRDTRIEINGVGTAKFNAAYTYGGPSGTIAAVKELCGVTIDHYAEIDFEGLVGLVDSIGGIDVVVDETIDDPDAGPIVIPAGEQHLNGEAALVFSRSRAYVDGDFTRVSNQRKVIEAIIHKGLEAPATELYGLVKTSTSFLTTDSGMDVDFIYSLADQMRHNNDDPLTLYTATIPATTGMIGDASYVIADSAGVAELMQVFLACGDVGAGVVTTSIDEDVSQAQSGSGSQGYSYDYYIEGE